MVVTAAPKVDPSALDDRAREVFLFIAGVVDTVDDPRSADEVARTLRESGLVRPLDGAGAWALTKSGDRLLADLRTLDEGTPPADEAPETPHHTPLGARTPTSVVAHVMADRHLDYLRNGAAAPNVPADQDLGLWLKELGLYAATGEYCGGEPLYVTTVRGKEVLFFAEGLRGKEAPTRRVDTRRRPQPRRSISLKGRTYARLKVYCDAQGSSVSGYLESVLGKILDEAGVDDPPAEAYPPKQSLARIDEIASQHFTF